MRTSELIEKLEELIQKVEIEEQRMCRRTHPEIFPIKKSNKRN